MEICAHPVIFPISGDEGTAETPGRVHAGTGIVDGGKVADGDGETDGQWRCGFRFRPVRIDDAEDDEYEDEAEEELDAEALDLAHLVGEDGFAQAGRVEGFRGQRLQRAEIGW